MGFQQALVEMSERARHEHRLPDSEYTLDTRRACAPGDSMYRTHED